ncbi:MAG: hypothetical protein QM619_11490 [Micropruina sp.]|uniref:hypothetical protein n=1 Tax=Micropruina sp. TaxID=2737536 RepID=UPI0039E41712
MDISWWVMVIVIGWTVLGLVLVAVLWARAPWKAVLAWLGIALIPLGVWLVGLSQAAIDGWNTLALWWQGLTYTLPVMVGLSLLGLAGLLLLVSRFVPNRPRKRKSAASIPPAAPYRPAQPRSEAEPTLILPENRPQG